MANIKKSFNFRNGFQIDDDNVVVNVNGQVGIGSTVPLEVLDVIGNVRVTGVVTATETFTRSLTVTGFTTLTSGSIGKLSISETGIITSTNPGVTTLSFFGDGAGLINIPTSQWIDVDPGIAQASIYAAGNVGVSTNFPVYSFQVGGSGANVTVFDKGLGIDRFGNVYTSGIITATSSGGFSGPGSRITNLNADNLASGSVPTTILPTIPNDKLPSNMNLSGIVTASTFSGQFIGIVTGNLVGIATTAIDLISTANININQVASGFATCGLTTIAKLDVRNTSTNNGTIGINTVTHRSDLHIVKVAGISSILLTSAPNRESIITLGRNFTNRTGAIRFGGNSEDADLFNYERYSNGGSLDIINYDNGNLNSYISNSISKFHWIYRTGSGVANPMMTLTPGGTLIVGSGVTDAQSNESLRVAGILTVTNGFNAFFDNNVTIKGGLNVGGTFNFNLDGRNLNASSGVSTVSTLSATTQLSVGGANPYTILGGVDAVIGDWNATGRSDCVVLNADGTTNGIGIGTTSIRTMLMNGFASGLGTSHRLDAFQAYGLFRSISVGTTSPASYVDFSNAGAIPGIGTFGSAYRFMIVPRISDTTTLAGGLRSAGAIVYDTSSTSFKGYNGSTWQEFSAGGTIANATNATNATNINISATTSTDTTTSVVLVGSQATGNQAPFIDAGLTYDANTNTLTAGTFSGNFSGSISDATNASNINISATTSTDTNTSIVLVSSQATGNQAPFIDAGLTYNANTNTLTAGFFSGNGSGLTGVTATPSYTQNTQSGAYTLQSNDVGKYIDYTPTTGGGGNDRIITLSSTLGASPGQQVIIYVNNATGGGALPARLVASGVSLYYTGNSGSLASIEIDRNGVLTLLCVGTDAYVAYGTGLTAVP